MNLVILGGNLTRDTKLINTKSGYSKSVVNIAVPKFVNGENKADFPKIIVWGKYAENLVKYKKKGSYILVTGKLTIRTYEKDGKTVYIEEVVADKVEFVDRSGKPITPSNDFDSVGNEEFQDVGSTFEDDFDKYVMDGPSFN